LVDAVTLVAVVQTFVLTFTLVVFIFQFRSQERALHESSYQALMGRYNDFVMSMTGAPEMAELLSDQNVAAGGSPVATKDAAMASQMMIVYGILEEAHELYSKKWIDRATWEQWDAWLRVMCGHPAFVAIHRRTRGMYNSGFEEHVASVLGEAAKK
jgi:hypothetical protein